MLLLSECCVALADPLCVVGGPGIEAHTASFLSLIQEKNLFIYIGFPTLHKQNNFKITNPRSLN
jgi:hypothetical protein